MTAKDCIAANDIETAYDRFQTTSNRWKEHWWNAVVTIYNNVREFAQKYVLDPINRLLQKVKKRGRPRSVFVDIRYCDTFDRTWDENTECEKAYLFKFYGAEGLMFSKIGTTSRNCTKRADEEMKYYKKHGLSVDYVELVRVVPTDDCAEGFESYARAILMRKYPGAWVKNDRFFNVDIPVETFERLFMQYKTT